MKFICVLLLLAYIQTYSQQSDDEVLNEQQIEEIAEEEESEPEDEFNVQQLEALRRDPVNINDKSASLSELPVLTSLQLNNLLTYRNLLGPFLSIYELQAVPGFSADVIKKIRPYITIAESEPYTELIRKRFKAGTHSFLSRPTIPSKIYLRYKYQYRNLLQYGILGERDAGERSLIDFYSFHLFARNTGIIKALAIGDYTLNLGQGLIHWQSQAFRKTSSVINIKRQADIIRPYHSAGEYNFQRGVALTLKKQNWETTLFGSHRRLTANISQDINYGEVITSVNTSGLHRTENEIENKNNASVLNYGGNLKHLYPSGNIGINGIVYNYSLPLLKRDEPYNIYAIKGSKWVNYSIDYSHTIRNIHLFGEIAFASNSGRAIVNGAMTSIHSSIDLAILYRKLDKNYQSLYGNAFSENTMPSNEEGLYMGVSLRPHQYWKIDGYADFFRFPWLKYRVNAPSRGNQYLVLITWKPNKQVEVYSKFRIKSKSLNVEGPVQFPDDQVQKNWRTHISFQVTRSILLRNRVEICWYRPSGFGPEQTGHLFYTDVVYKPIGRSYSGSFRFQSFESDVYETRLYAYENDVLFASSIPSFYDKGLRVYCNGRIKIKSKLFMKSILDVGFKAATTFYFTGSRSSDPAVLEARLQVLISPAG